MNEEKLYKAPTVHRDLEDAYVLGSLEEIVKMIAEGNTGSRDAREFARWNLERLSDPSLHIKAVGGTKP